MSDLIDSRRMDMLQTISHISPGQYDKARAWDHGDARRGTMTNHPTQLWMDFITGRISHEVFIAHVRRARDPMDCPATGGRHTEHRGEPNQNGDAIYCTNCGYRWSYRNRSQAELDAHNAAIRAYIEAEAR